MTVTAFFDDDCGPYEGGENPRDKSWQSSAYKDVDPQFRPSDLEYVAETMMPGKNLPELVYRRVSSETVYKGIAFEFLLVWERLEAAAQGIGRISQEQFEQATRLWQEMYRMYIEAQREGRSLDSRFRDRYVNVHGVLQSIAWSNGYFFDDSQVPWVDAE